MMMMIMVAKHSFLACFFERALDNNVRPENKTTSAPLEQNPARTARPTYIIDIQQTKRDIAPPIPPCSRPDQDKRGILGSYSATAAAASSSSSGAHMIESSLLSLNNCNKLFPRAAARLCHHDF